MTRLCPAAALALLAAVVALVALGASGCGDNTSPCGAGAIEQDGVCVPSGGTACGDGTRLEHGQCVIDPTSCLAGTVLIGNRCADPTAGLTIDLDEAAEPNGLAIAAGVEASTAPAGLVALRPIGQTLVIHGHLAPFRDADHDGQLDPDVDTYLVTVAEPTLLDVAVDGLGGVLAAFYVAGDPQADPAYERYGVSVTGDAVRRWLFLPAAGRYALAIADARSLAFGGNSPPPAGAGAAAGGPDAEYYASLTVEPIPAPAPIAVTGGTGSQAGTLSAGEVKFFTAALPAGTSDLRDAMPGAAAASLSVIRAGQLAGYADENPGTASRPPSAALVSLAVQPGDVPLIVVDAVYNYGPAAEPFTLTIAPR